MKLVKALLNDLKHEDAHHAPLSVTDDDLDGEIHDIRGGLHSRLDGGLGTGLETEGEVDAQVAKAKLLRAKREKGAAAA